MSGETWKITGRAAKPDVQAALLAHEDVEDWDPELVISGHEEAADRPQDWVIEAWYPRRPGKAQKSAIAALFAKNAPRLTAKKLPDEDWLTRSQEGAEPIDAGRFHVRTPEYPAPADPQRIDIVIPAGQAFGTGQHETTAGCLAMLDAMKRRGVLATNIADIGTGTGLLALAALRLWPRSLMTASDIDPVCLPVIEDNAARNAQRMGARPGEVLMVVAPGTDHRLIRARAPYDLVIANILAAPLIELAPDFAEVTMPRANLLLAGLLRDQEEAVRRSYSRQGFRLAARLVRGNWSILWLRRRVR